MKYTREDALELHASYTTGESLDDIAQRLGVTREAVRQLFDRHDLPRRSHAERSAQARQEMTERVKEAREQIIALYKEHGTVDAVVEIVRLPRPLVSAVIDTIPNRETYRRQSDRVVYERPDLISALQTARDQVGEPLSAMTYQEIAPIYGLPAFATVLRHFELDDPDQPWQAALEAAGIQGNPPRGKRAGAYTTNDCVEAVMDCFTDHDGDRVSYGVYERWARKNKRVSGATVRSVIGWNPAVELALDRLEESVS